MFHGQFLFYLCHSYLDDESRLYIHQGGPLALQSATQLNHGGLSLYNLWFVPTFYCHLFTDPEAQVSYREFERAHQGLSVIFRLPVYS